MRLGIISDTHGQLRREIFEVFAEVDRILDKMDCSLGFGQVRIRDIRAKDLRHLLLDGVGHGAADAASRAGDQRPIPLQHPWHGNILSHPVLD